MWGRFLIIPPLSADDGGTSSSLQKQQQRDMLEMLEEAIRFLFSHPRLAEEPLIAAFGGRLLTASAIKLGRWRCFTERILKDGAGDGGAGSSESAGLCSSQLRLISLALTAGRESSG